MKYCFHCMKKIPSLADRCPYCISDEQSIWGRIILLALILAALIALAHRYG